MGLLSWRASVLACALIAMVTPVSAQQKLQKARDLFYEQEYQSALDIYLLIFDTQNELDNLNLDNI